MPVPEAATVCHKCGKDPQSISRWSGFLASSQGTLGLLIALFSVLGTIIALLSSLTFFHRSRTDLIFFKLPPAKAMPVDRGLTLEVTAYNSGNSPALLSGARLVSRFEGKDWPTPLELETPELEQIRIDRDDFKILRLTLLGGWDLQRFRMQSPTEKRYQELLKARHRIEVGVQEFGKQLEWRTVRAVPGPELKAWLSDVTMEPESTSSADEKK